jgi:hypothetical protein
MLRPPRVRPPDRRGGSPKRQRRSAKRAPPPPEVASLVRRRRRTLTFHGRRSRVSDLWGTPSRQRCAHHRALSNGRHLAGDPRGLWRAQRGCDGLRGTVARRCFGAARLTSWLNVDPVRLGSRVSGSLAGCKRVRSTDEASSGRRFEIDPFTPFEEAPSPSCCFGFNPSFPRKRASVGYAETHPLRELPLGADIVSVDS